MNSLVLRSESIERDKEFFDLDLELQIKLKELERAQEAVKQTEHLLDLAVMKSLKSKNLKYLEGEIVHVPEVNRLYCFANNDFIFISPTPDIEVLS